MDKKFMTEMQFEISSSDFLFVRNIYQPIIGSEAASLYQLLIDYNTLSKYRRTFFSFKNVSNALGIDFLALEQARTKLEAVGLIRTFERADNLHFIFIINKPLKPQSLRANSLLFKQVILKIGEEAFERIEFSTKGDKLGKDEYKEISIKYQDLFDLNVTNDQTTLEIPLPNLKNKEDAIKALTAFQFVKYITNTRVSPSLLFMIQNLQKIGFSSTSLNLIMNYSFEINGKIIANHIKTIAYDLHDKKIIDSSGVEFELKAAMASKKHKQSSLESTFVANEKYEDVNSWEETFKALGEF